MAVKQLPPQKTVAAESKFWRSIATNFRKRRFALFKTLLAPLPRPLTILDVGGTQKFWETMEYISEDVNIILLNTERQQSVIKYPNMKAVVGDAKSMPEYTDKQFGVVFSNSVIEHLGTLENQRQMAEEIKRVGQRYYVQTPNRHFPVEPHVLLPFFQFYPQSLAVFLITHFKTPWGWRIANKEKAIRFTSSLRLMTEKELRELFPGAKISKEKVLGLTKSFTVYNEW